MVWPHEKDREEKTTTKDFLMETPEKEEKVVLEKAMEKQNKRGALGHIY